MEPKFPDVVVPLVGQDGNYDNLLRVTMDTVSIDNPELDDDNEDW